MPSLDLSKLHDDLATTEQEVGSIIESFIELGVSIYDFPGTSEAAQGMMTNLQRNVDRLRNLNRKSNDPDSQLAGFQVPMEVLQYIEDGRNPDVYTRDFVEAIRRSNQYQRAKMNGVKQLRDKLAEKIVAEFPDMQDSVKDILQRTDR
ncbi:mediator complex subunit NUT2 LALA0_S05e04698g [Lachancea lanzarotensis]|uniref:Mediator of RNA polymerase II transcription subunit 10 n=1 Tax=Lachancea lanzarotensis TaxID=1245769 RepID=A0A0C7NA84_9SACH|nr:uncharacterized protein LALA0_S05e04698g [Lachancea lanzarotensis]CEP62396.1 LALA0S05e04698g1_1 [Lachancea lanzarotensis]